MSSPHGATWRSGYATVCKTVYSGSIPDVASTGFCTCSGRSKTSILRGPVISAFASGKAFVIAGRCACLSDVPR